MAAQVLLSLFCIEAHARLNLKLRAISAAGHDVLRRSPSSASCLAHADLANKRQVGATCAELFSLGVACGARMVHPLLARVALDLVHDGGEVVGLDSV